MDSDAEIADLKDTVNKLRKRLREMRDEQEGEAVAGPKVSPLAPAGFPLLPAIDGVRFAAAAAGVKYKDRADVMLAEICEGAAIAGVFTKSSTRSAPVLDCQNKLAALALGEQGKGGLAFVVNSGNSNAFTGGAGITSVNAISDAVAHSLGVSAGHVFTSSTGVIGEPLPHDRIVSVVDDLKAGLAPGAIQNAAKAIMTTDTFPKGSVQTLEIDGVPVKIAGIAKGSGMIAPDMATMLVYIFTDANISQSALQTIVSTRNKISFNAITVDGDTSTSDTLLVAATCRAPMRRITGARSPQGRAFADALGKVMLDLAHQVVKDGEGATKFVEVRVTGATTTANAQKVALATANSPLVKTAIAGEDPNWGRVVMAVGKSGAVADRDKLTIKFGDILVAENGWVSPDYAEAAGANYMKQPELRVHIDLGLGTATATVWTCDLTHQYITINADYRS